jgi:hypothetical protein
LERQWANQDRFTEKLFASKREIGGRGLSYPVEYGHSTVRSYVGAELWDTTPKQIATNATQEFARIVADVSLLGDDLDANQGGKEALIDYGRAVVENTMRSIMWVNDGPDVGVAAQLYGDGSGNSGKDLAGLFPAADNGAYYQVYNNIARTSGNNVWWDAQVYALGASQSLSADLTFTHLIDAYEMGRIDGQYPDWGITSRAIHSRIWSLLITPTGVGGSYRTATPNVYSSKLPFAELEIEYSSYYPDGPGGSSTTLAGSESLLLLRSDSWLLWHLPNRAFNRPELKKSWNNDTIVGHTLFKGNIACLRPRQNVIIRARNGV